MEDGGERGRRWRIKGDGEAAKGGGRGDRPGGEGGSFVACLVAI